MGHKSRNQSTPEGCCPHCKKQVEDTEKDSICCNGCEVWWHGSCGGIEVKDIPILSKYASVHWYCTKCEEKRLQGKSSNVWKALNQINHRQKKDNETRKQETQLIESMKKDLLTIKLKLDNPERTTSSYATVAKTEPPDRMVDPKEEVGNVNKQRSPRDPNKILIITCKQKFRDSIEIKRTFAKLFPLKKLIYAFTTARGNTHMEFLTVEEADNVLKSWNPEFFGGESIARKANDKTNEHSALIRGVPLELDNNEIEQHLDNNFPGVKARRFVKADKTALQTVKLSLPSKLLYDKATSDGIFLDALFYQPVEFVQQGIRIIRCYKCQKFGHMSSNCHSRESCKHCAEEHSVAKCTNKDKPAKCSNCKGNHEADDTNCPTYIKQIRTVHEARGIPIPVKNG